MQSYDSLLDMLQPQSKAVKDGAAAAVRHQKAIQKSLDAGNLVEARKSLAALSAAIEQLRAQTDALNQTLEGFDAQDYFVSGDFTRELLEACDKRGIDVKGEKGVYEMFPYKLRILGDDEHPAEVWMDRKKVPSCRPAYVADTIQKGQGKLYAANFKAQTFMNELADAYETACLRSGARQGSTQLLTKVYRCMAPTARARKDYDTQAFAFDLARLYEAGTEAWVTRNGTRFDFGTSRDGSTGIRVLSRSGVESYISTLRPLQNCDD